MTYTDAELIARYHELKAALDAICAEQELVTKPYNDALNAIKGAMLARLQEQGHQNVKTDEGTAYQQTTMSVKVDNRDALMEFVRQNNRTDMLDIGVLKDPVKDWLDTHDGVAPPGVAVSFFTKCNIRKS